MKLIVGLGNPGKDYALTRHNVGFMALDRLATLEGDTFKPEKKCQAEVCKTSLNGRRVVLAKPTTFMNNSGITVRALLDFYKIKASDVIVIHDDKDFPLGDTKVQTDRGAGGHNGVLSIIEHLGTKAFTRIRIGVAPTDREIIDTADFVLGKFTSAEQKTLVDVLDHVVTNTLALIG